MCEKCDNSNDWKFCPYCGAELKKKMSQEEFDKIFLDMLKSYNNVVWLDEHGRISDMDIPTCRFLLRNSHDEWIFDIKLDPKNSHFFFSYDRVWVIFHRDYGLEYNDVQRLMKNQMSKLFKMDEVTPFYDNDLDYSKMSKLFKMDEVTPCRSSHI